MRALIVAFVSSLALAASAPAAPPAPQPDAIELGAASPIQLVDHACGWGWHHVRWQDHWGALELALRSVCPSLSQLARHEARTSLRRLARSDRGLW